MEMFMDLQTAPKKTKSKQQTKKKQTAKTLPCNEKIWKSKTSLGEVENHYLV